MAEFNVPKIKIGKTDKETIDNLLNAYEMMRKQMEFFAQHLDSDNVTEINTNQTTVKSDKGATRIKGPLLLMSDKQSPPLLRLMQGYDDDSAEFVYRLMDIGGNVTFSVNSLGQLQLSGQPLIEIYDTDNVLRRRIGWHDNTLADEWYSPSGEVTAYVDTDGKLVVVFGEFKGTIDIGSGNFTVDITGTARTKQNLTVGKDIYIGSEELAAAIRMGSAFLECRFEGGKYNWNFYSGGYFDIISEDDMEISSGTRVRPGGLWDCDDAEFPDLNDGASYYALESWAAKKGNNTGNDSHSHTITIDGVDYTTSTDTHHHNQT